jgi:hypothetical protein
LYRELDLYEKYRGLVERNLRCDPTLIPYIRSFTSYDPSFLKWMWMQMTTSLKKLVLRWDNTVEINAYSEILESIPQSIEELIFELRPAFEFRTLNSRRVFGGLRYLYLRNEAKSEYTLQTILDQLHCPSLEVLEVANVTDWRIQWRDSFDDAIPNLGGLELHIKDWEGREMFDGEEDQMSEEQMPPSSVMWNTVLTLYRRSIFFDISYYNPDSPFLDYAPSYASAHRLDPVPLVQWLVRSLQFFRAKKGIDYFFVGLGDISLSDLSIFLRSMKPMNFRGSKMQLALNLPYGTTTAIAALLPDNISQLSISLRFDGFLDPSVVPECIRSLPNLKHLQIWINVSKDDFQPRSGCTAATCFLGGMSIMGVQFGVTRGSDPVWNHVRHQRYIDKHDLGDVVDFEMEVKEWFRLSASLESVEFGFE